MPRSRSPTSIGARRKSAWWSASTVSTGRRGPHRIPNCRRRRAALRFDRVLSCKCKQVTPTGKDKVLNLLAVEFEASDTPAGVVTLVFSGGAALRLEVECLEVELVDLGPVPPPRRVRPIAEAPGFA